MGEKKVLDRVGNLIKESKRDEKKEKVRDIKNFMFLVFPRAGSL